MSPRRRATGGCRRARSRLTIATGDQCGFPEIIGAYDAVASWAKENGRELDGSPREIYHSDPGKGEEDRFEIAWPIR